MSKKLKIMLIIVSAVLAVAIAALAIILTAKKDEDLVVPDNTKILEKSGYKLVISGNSEYVVLLPKNASSNEYLSAKELTDVIFNATGAKIEIVYEGDYKVNEGAPLISIGNTELSRTENVRDYDGDLLSSGYFMKTVGNRLYLLSDGDGLGLVYGAYDFLEDAVGYMYYYVDEIYYEHKKDVDLYVYDGAVMPDIDFRATLYPDTTQNSSYRTHLRYSVWDESYAGGRAHTQTASIVNYDKFKATHAYGATKTVGDEEIADHWFSSQANAQLCWTAGEEMERQAAADIYAIVKKSTEKQTFFHVSQADNALYCDCDRCKKAKTEWAYNDAGLQIAWANNVCKYLKEMMQNDGLEKEVNVVLFAYMGTETPPVVTTAEGNYKAFSDKVLPCDMLYFEWAPIYTDYSVGYDHVNNKEYRENLLMWKDLLDESGLKNRMSVWTYEVNFKNLLFLFDNASTFASNMKFFSENGINNVFSQGANTTNQPALQEMRLFVESRIMWDASRNYDELVDEFLSHYYDGASTAIRKYYDATRLRYAQTSVLDGMDFSSIYSDISSKTIWTEGFVDEIDRIFKEAYQSIETVKTTDLDRYNVLYDRIKRAELTLTYVKLSYYPINYSVKEKSNMAKEWKYYVSKFGIKQLQENNSPDISTIFQSFER